MANDMEWTNLLLYQHKLAASMLTTGVMECANDQIRSHFSNLLNRTLDHQKQIFDIMNQKGWYKVEPAPHDQLSRTQQSMATIQQQLQ